MGVFAGDRWIVCVCKSRVTKKGEVTMPEACWDGAQGGVKGSKEGRGLFMRPVRVKQNKRLLPRRLGVVSKA